MIAGFVIWSAVSAILFLIGVLDWKSKKAVGFYSGVKPPAVSDVRKYNRSVAVLWFAYAAVFELLGIPLLFLKQNAAGFLFSIPGVAAATVALAAVYSRILRRFEQKK